MNDWKATLYKLEKLHEWDVAIALMEQVIKDNPNCVDAYLSMAFLLMNLLVEEHDCDMTKFYDYIAKLTQCYEESKAKFPNDPDYLYYMGTIGWMSHWFFGKTVTEDDMDAMIHKAHSLEPAKLLYCYHKYNHLDITKKNERDALLSYLTELLNPNSMVRKDFAKRGSLGEYMLGIYEPWAIKQLASIENFLAGNLFSSQVFSLLRHLLLAVEIPDNLSARAKLAKTLTHDDYDTNNTYKMIINALRTGRETDFFTKEEAYQAIMDFLLQYYNEYHEKEILAFKNQLAENKAVFEKYFMQVLHHKS